MIELLKDAIRELEKARTTGQAVYFDCALIYIQGAIEIAELHKKHEEESRTTIHGIAKAL